jgi:hypothetical protein
VIATGIVAPKSQIKDHHYDQIRCLVIVACALVAGCRTTPDSTRWEYKVATFHQRRSLTPDANSEGGLEAVREAQENLLNDMGREGWVLVSQNDGRIFYFKRPVRQGRV